MNVHLGGTLVHMSRIIDLPPEWMASYISHAFMDTLIVDFISYPPPMTLLYSYMLLVKEKTFSKTTSLVDIFQIQLTHGSISFAQVLI